MTSWFKRGIVRALENPLAVRLLKLPANERCAILLLHRFSAPGDRNGFRDGHDVSALRRILVELRKNDIGLVDVAEKLQQIDSGVSGAGSSKLSVAFTVDDGYTDLVELAGPVFAEFDCPVTGFVVPDAVEGRAWFWWDKIDWILRHSERRALHLELGGQPILVEWADEGSRLRARSRLEGALKQVPHQALSHFIEQLAELTDLPLPLKSPEEYRVLTWDELRAAERRGLRFGAHSMTHPILSRCDDLQSRFEILESIRRVREELTNPSPVFCYPNGYSDDFGFREHESIRESGIKYALTTCPAVVNRRLASTAPEWRMRVPRFTYDERFGQLVRYLAA